MRLRLSAGIFRFAAVLLLTATVVAAAAAAARLLPAEHSGAVEGLRTTVGPTAPAVPGSADLLTKLDAATRLDPALERAVLNLATGSLTASVAGEPLPEPGGLLEATGVGREASDLLTGSRTGVFVTAIMNNQVRACVGSIWASTPSLAREISHYGALVAARDLRRPPIEGRELDRIALAVSIVGRLERVVRGQAWDPATFGVFVRSGARTGVILPGEALTHAKQLSWALAEAGVAPSSSYEIYRFQTVKFGASLSVRG